MTGEQTVAGVIAAFLTHRRAKGLVDNSLRVYERWLAQWASWRAARGEGALLSDVSIASFRAFFAYLATEHVPHSTNPRRPAVDRQGLVANTQASCWRTLRTFWNFCAGEGWLTAEQLRFFANNRLPAPRVDEPIRPYVDRPLLDQLLAAVGPETDEQAARDRAILALLYETGLRVSELCSLVDGDVAIERRRARVVGKGGQHAYVFWGRRAHHALRAYLRVRSGPVGGPLLRGLSSTNKGQALTGDAIRGIVKRRAAKAGVALPPGAPVHSLRHGFAHALLDAAVDPLRLQQLLRHRDPASTRRYTREHPDKLQDAHGRAFG